MTIREDGPRYTLAELLANPKRLQVEIEKERRSKAPPGWLGLSVLGRNCDWQFSLRLGDGVRQVDVHPKSPACRAGLRTGDFVKPIQANGAAGIPVEDFDSLALPAGTMVLVEFWRANLAKWHVIEIPLSQLPRAPKIPRWKKLAQIPCGRRVARKERPKFLNKMSRQPDITPLMYKCLSIATIRLDDDRKNGFRISYADWAEAVNCNRRTLMRLVERLHWLGLIRIAEGPTSTWTINLFQVTWPDFSPAARPEQQPTIWA